MIAFRDAVVAMSEYDNRPEMVQAIYDAVEPICNSDTEGLEDWLSCTGAYDGKETPHDLAAEWDGLSNI